MSNGKIRHFWNYVILLCLYRKRINGGKSGKVERNEQLLAVKYVSNNMINEIKKFGSQGNVLYQFFTSFGNNI